MPSGPDVPRRAKAAPDPSAGARRSANRIAWRLIAAGLAGTIAGFAVFANIVSERRFADSEAGREVLKRQWIEEGGRGGFAITSRVQMGQEAMIVAAVFAAAMAPLLAVLLVWRRPDLVLKATCWTLLFVDIFFGFWLWVYLMPP